MIRHDGYWKPRVIPFYGDLLPTELDRIQNLTGSPTLPVTQLYEVGRKDKVCSVKGIPECPVSMTQYEYGSLEAYLQFANKSGVDTLTLDDFSDAFVDILGYEGESDTSHKATILIPKCRMNSMGLNISAPDAIAERSFNFTGDTKLTWQGNNKYFIFKRYVVDTGEIESNGSTNIVVNDPVAVANPWTGVYLYRVLLVRGSSTTLLTLGTDYTYTALTNTLNVLDVQLGDVIKVYYAASTYIAGQQPFVNNDVDSCALYASYASIYLVNGLTGNYIHRLNSLSLDASFERQDVKEIGSRDTVETGIKSKKVTVKTSGYVDGYTFEEVLSGVAADYGLIDPERFLDTISIVVKVYSNYDKTNFKIGYRIDNLTVASTEQNVPVNDFETKGVSLESDNMTITTNESTLGI